MRINSENSKFLQKNWFKSKNRNFPSKSPQAQIKPNQEKPQKNIKEQMS